MEIKTSIIIPTFQREKILNECLRSILDTGMNELEVIIVNDDIKHQLAIDERNSSSLFRIVNNKKKGVASARNTGASLAKSDILLFVDDDMLLNRKAIEKAVAFLHQHPNNTYNANWVYEENLMKSISTTKFGRYLIANGYTSLKGWNQGGIEWKEDAMLHTEGITSQFFAIRRSDFERIGGYDEHFPYAGFEDYDINMKLKKNGITNNIDTSVCIFHNETDRVELLSWLERKRRGSVTRKVAVEMGFKELALEYSTLKVILLSILSFCSPLLYLLLRIIPNINLFDPIFASVVNILIAVNIYKGYHQQH